MKVQVETVSSIEKRLVIEVDAAVVDTELSAAYTQLSRQVKMPGFRAGKVPRRILEQKYKSDVEADVLRRVQMRSVLEAIQQNKLPAMGDPQFSGGAIAANKPLAFTARVEVKPEITAKDYKGLKLKRFDVMVTDAQVDEQIERMRQSRAQVSPITDRDVAKMGDYAVIDFDATHDGKAFAGNTGRGVQVEVKAGQLIEGDIPELEGLKIGAEKTFTYTFPADYRVEEIKGKAAQFKVTLKELKKKDVPALDDAFATTLGFKTVAELKERIKKDLERGQKNRNASDEREGVFKALIEKNTFDIPESLVSHATDVLLDSVFQNMFNSGVDPRALGLDFASLRAEMRPKSELEVRGQLLLEAISRQEKIEVSAGDIDAKLAEFAEETSMPITAVRKQYTEPRAHEALKNRILEDKAVAFVKQSATFE